MNVKLIISFFMEFEFKSQVKCLSQRMSILWHLKFKYVLQKRNKLPLSIRKKKKTRRKFCIRERKRRYPSYLLSTIQFYVIEVSIFNIVYHSKSAAECSAFSIFCESANVRYIRRVCLCVCMRVRVVFSHIYVFICLFPSHLYGKNPLHLAITFVIELIYFAFRVVYNRISVICSSVVFVILFRIHISSCCLCFLSLFLFVFM